MRNLKTIALMLLIALVLAGCADDGSSDNDDPVDAAAEAIEAYWQAIVSADMDAFLVSICPAYEAEAMMEFDSFGAVEASLDGLACITSSSEDGTAQVACEGTINVTYDGETGELADLSGQTYVAEQVDGEWKMCGYE